MDLFLTNVAVKSYI